MLMRFGGDDPAERSKHGIPRQQDLTQQQSPQSPSQPQKQQFRQVPHQQPFHQEPGPQVKQDAPRQEPIHQQQEPDQNQEPQLTPRQKTTSSHPRTLKPDGDDVEQHVQSYERSATVTSQESMDLADASPHVRLNMKRSLLEIHGNSTKQRRVTENPDGDELMVGGAYGW